MGFWEVVLTLILGIVGGMVANEFCEWAEHLSQWFLRIAARRLPGELKARFSEEWQSHLSEIPGRLARVVFAIGLVLGAVRIRYQDALSLASLASLMWRIADFVAALVLLVGIAPLLIVFALAVLLDGGRPIFHFQPRIRDNGQRFTLITFRPMRTEDGHRLSSVGRFMYITRIDDLPMLFNVLRGNITLWRAFTWRG